MNEALVNIVLYLSYGGTVFIVAVASLLWVKQKWQIKMATVPLWAFWIYDSIVFASGYIIIYYYPSVSGLIGRELFRPVTGWFQVSQCVLLLVMAYLLRKNRDLRFSVEFWKKEAKRSNRA